MPTPAQFTTVTTEGGLLPSDLISRLVNDTRSLPGTREEDYWITPGRQLREIINRSWNDMLGAWQVFQPHMARLSPDDHTATLTWDRWLLPLFAELGYGRLERYPEAIEVDGKDYPVSHHHEQALIHLVGWNVRLDRRTAGVAGAAKAAPHSMVQELLNRTDDHLWAILSNGRQLRVLRDNSSLTRAAYVEFDLEQMFSEGIFTDFVALWLLVHGSRFEGDPQSECWLELWATEARQQGVRALDTLGQGFEDAIETLGQGFLAHPANNNLRERLRDGLLSKQDFYRQLLRLVYRLVFLLVAEDRELLHPPDVTPEAKERYARYYSLSRIRELARRRRGTKHSDLWDQIAIVVHPSARKVNRLWVSPPSTQDSGQLMALLISMEPGSPIRTSWPPFGSSPTGSRTRLSTGLTIGIWARKSLDLSMRACSNSTQMWTNRLPRSRWAMLQAMRGRPLVPTTRRRH